MKLHRPDAARRIHHPSKELLQAPRENLAFNIGEFVEPEIWERIGSILLKQFEHEENLWNAANDFAYSALALSLLDPEKLHQLRSNEQAKAKMRLALEEVNSSDKSIPNLLLLSIAWLFPDLNEVEIIRYLVEEASEEVRRGDPQGFMDLLLLEPSLIGSHPLTKEIVANILSNGMQMEEDETADIYLALSLLIEAALFKSFLPDPKPLIKMAKTKHAEYAGVKIRRDRNTELEPIATTVQLLSAAFVRAVFANDVKIKGNHFVLQDRPVVLKENNPLPERLLS